jgi:hypothetical protein
MSHVPVDPQSPPSPGKYLYRQRGHALIAGVEMGVPSLGTLMVDAAERDGTQKWRRFIDPDGLESEVVQRWTPQGVYLLSSVQRQQVAGNVLTVTCNFSQPMLVVPFPTIVGYTGYGSCDCEWFEPNFRLQVIEQANVQLAGAQLDVDVIESTLTSTGPIRALGRQVDWVSWSLGTLYVRQEVTLEIELWGVEVFNSLTCDLVSGEPT